VHHSVVERGKCKMTSRTTVRHNGGDHGIPLQGRGTSPPLLGHHNADRSGFRSHEGGCIANSNTTRNDRWPWPIPPVGNGYIPATLTEGGSRTPHPQPHTQHHVQERRRDPETSPMYFTRAPSAMSLSNKRVMLANGHLSTY
jgi:hypothetical protein